MGQPCADGLGALVDFGPAAIISTGSQTTTKTAHAARRRAEKGLALASVVRTFFKGKFVPRPPLLLG
jgi:hypothetical protein